MNKGLCMPLSVGALLLMIPALALGWSFDYQIYGNILESPVEYNGGGLLSGGDGIFEFTLDDSGWPVGPPGARFDYIWATYFAANWDNSAPGAFKWVGQIPGTFYLESSNAPIGYNGWCEGTIMAKITVRDLDEDGILDYNEKWADHLFDGRLSKLCDHSAGGEMAYKWGWGALASNYFNFVMPPGRDTLYNGGNLTLMPGCTTADQPSSWGSIKALYR